MSKQELMYRRPSKQITLLYPKIFNKCTIDFVTNLVDCLLKLEKVENLHTNNKIWIHP